MLRIVTIFLLISICLYSQSIKLVDVDASDYPIVKSKLIALDQNNNPQILNSNNLNLSDNSENISFSVENCTPNQVNEFANIAYIVSLSDAMSIVSNEILIPGLQTAIDLMNPEESNLAILGYASNTYLISDFTANKNTLNASLQNLFYSGHGNINAPFFSQTQSLSDLYGARQNKSAVLIIDNDNPADSLAITNYIDENDITLYVIAFSTNVPHYLKKISRASEGIFFENIRNANDFISSINLVDYHSKLADKNSAFCNVSFDVNSCTEKRELRAFYDGFESRFEYFLPADKLVSIAYEINNNINFGEVAPGTDEIRTIKFTARNEKIVINDITGSNSIFNITNVNFPINLEPNQSINLAVRFAPLDTRFVSNEFTIVSNACAGSRFFAFGGATENGLGDRTLKVEFPNGGESFFNLSDTTFRWSGIADNDSVRVQLSTDNGKTWATLTTSARNNKFSLRLPNVESDSCLIRIRQEAPELSRETISIFDEHDLGVISVSWSHDMQNLSSGDANSFYKWRATDNQIESTHNSTQSNIIQFSTMSPNGSLIASSDNNNRVRVWNANATTAIPILDLVSGSKKFINLKFSYDSSLLAGASDDGFIYLWSLQSENPIATVKAHNDSIRDIEWNLQSNRIASVSDDGFVKIWDVGDDELLGTTLTNRPNKINSISWNPSGSNIAFGGRDNQVQIWDLQTRQQLLNFNIGNQEIKSIDWSKEQAGRFIAVAGTDSLVYLWSNQAGQVLYNYPFHRSRITDLRIASDGRKVASSDLSGEVHLWNISDLPFQNIVIQADTSDSVFSIIRPNISASNFVFPENEIGNRIDTLLKNYLINNTDIDIIIDSIRITGPNANSFFVSSKTEKLIIPKKDSIDLLLSGIGDSEGFKSGVLNFYFHGRTYTRSLSMSVNQNSIEVINDYIDLGKVNLESTKDTSLQIFRNTTNNDIIFNAVNRYFDTNQFTDDSDSQFNLDAGDSKILNLSFEAQKLGKTSYLIEYQYQSISSPIEIHAVAEVVAPKAQFIETFEIADSQCELSPVDTIISIKNIGQGSLVISDYYFTNDQIITQLLGFTEATIAPNDSILLNVRFEPQSNGEYQTELILKTNIQEDLTDSITIQLNYQISQPIIEINQNIVTFDLQQTNQSGAQTLMVYNTGNEEAMISLSDLSGTLFRVLNIEKNPIPVEDSSLVVIEFIGALQPGSYSDDFKITDNCGKEFDITLLANVGIVDAQIEIVDEVIFDKLRCFGSFQDKIVRVKNSGTTTLVISDAVIEDDESAFWINSTPIGRAISPNDSLEIVLQFSPIDEKASFGELILSTNAVNSNNGETRIQLRGTLENADFSVSHDTINFIDVIEGLERTAIFEIYNIGELPLMWNLPIEGGKFIIESIIPQTTQVNGSSIVSVRFLGGMEDNTYIETIPLINECNSIKYIHLTANVKGLADAGLRIADAEAEPGEIVQIPISIYSPKEIELPDVAGYETILRYRKTLLIPVGNTPRGQIVGEERQIFLTNLPAKPIIEGDSIIYYLEFIATLGDTSKTELKLSNTRARDNNEIDVIDNDGNFELTGICKVDGPRLIKYTGVFELKQNYPNPAINNTSIEFTLIEEGDYSLNLYDIYGNLVAVISEAYGYPGDYIANLNLSEFPIGNYIYVLRTRTMYKQKKLNIVR